MAGLIRSAYFMALFDWVQDESVDLFARASSNLDLLLDGMANSLT
jgi:hypothetical protein